MNINSKVVGTHITMGNEKINITMNKDENDINDANVERNTTNEIKS